jgi:hypothetical protein
MVLIIGISNKITLVKIQSRITSLLVKMKNIVSYHLTIDRSSCSLL